MFAILVESVDKETKQKIFNYVKRRGVGEYRVYSLCQSNAGDPDVSCLSIEDQSSEVLEVAFKLLDTQENEVALLAGRLSKIFGLDLQWFTRRVLINDLLVREAQILIAEQKLKKQTGINKITIFLQQAELLRGKDNVVFCGRKAGPFLFFKRTYGFICELLRKNGVDYGKPVEREVVCVVHSPGYFDLVEDSLRLIARKHALFLAINDLYGSGINHGEIGEEFRVIVGQPKLSFNLIFEYILKYLLVCRLGSYSEIFEARLANILKTKARVENFVKYNKPKLVISKNEYDVSENIEYAVFSKNKVKNVHYMHGDKIFEAREAYIESDNLLVWGKYYQELLYKLRCKSKTTVVGHQRLEKRAKDPMLKDSRLLQIRDCCNKIISVYTQTSYSQKELLAQEKMLRQLVGFVAQYREIYLIIKHHPLEFNYNTPSYEEILTPIKGKALRIKNNEIDLYETIMVADLIVTPNSVVGLEAILLEKQVLYVNLSANPDLNIFPKYKLAFEVNKENDVIPTIKRLLFGAGEHRENINYRFAKEYWANGLQGNAAELFNAEVDKELRERETSPPHRKK